MNRHFIETRLAQSNRRSTSGLIYFAACDPMEAVKIGFTRSNPIARLAGLQTGCPIQLRLLTYVPGTMEDERNLHMAFRALHIHGEWFRHEMKLKDFIWYLAEHAEQPPTYDDLDVAIGDVIGTGYFHPNMPPEYALAYEQSGVWSR